MTTSEQAGSYSRLPWPDPPAPCWQPPQNTIKRAVLCEMCRRERCHSDGNLPAGVSHVLLLRALAQNLTMPRPIRIVILSSCRSLGPGMDMCESGIPYVICWPTKVSFVPARCVVIHAYIFDRCCGLPGAATPQAGALDWGLAI